MSLLAKSLVFLWDVRVSVILCAGLAILLLAFVRERKWARAGVALAAALLCAIYLPSVLDYVGGLSSDSFAELSSPKLSEARFFLRTISSILEPVATRRVLATLLAAALLAALLVAIVRLRVRHATSRLSGLGWLVCITLLVAIGVDLDGEYRRSSAEIAAIRENYSGPAPRTLGEPRPLHVLVYVGESTGVMDLHLYGYHRETTPALDRRRATDPGLLVFDEALSTHTHTGASLMDVFGIPVPPGAAPSGLPIYERRYASVVEVLSSSGVDTVLLSNQASHGTWNAGGAAVFAHAGRRVSSFDSTTLGNKDAPASMRIDDESFFAAHLASVWRAPGPQAIFLHSYAGHGPYLQNIPEAWRSPVDGSLAQRDPPAIVGEANDAAAIVQGVDQYDSAMRYVDHSVDAIMQYAQASADPTVTIYFSDHGESPWTNRGHDSARLIHEMLRVPLLVYFNPAARAAYPDTFERYRTEAATVHPRYLSSLAGTLLDLFDLHTAPPVKTLFDDQRSLAPEGVVIRRLGDTISAIFPLAPPASSALASGRRDDSDTATRVFRVAAAQLGHPASGSTADSPSFCYHRANTMARARRAALVADCVEFDVAPHAGRIEVNHPPSAFTGYTLAEHFKVLEGSGRGLWIDAKDLGGADNCLSLAGMLESWARRPRQVMVEFPPTVALADPGMQACFAKLRALGVRRSFYVPTDTANDCTAALRQGRSDAATCTTLRGLIATVTASGAMSDLSFDYAGYDAVRSAPSSGLLRWDTWGISAADASAARFAGFGFVILDTSTDQNFH